MFQLTRNYFSQLLDYDEDAEFQIAFSNDQNHLRSSCTLENRTLSSSHVDASHVTQIKMAYGLELVSNGKW